MKRTGTKFNLKHNQEDNDELDLTQREFVLNGNDNDDQSNDQLPVHSSVTIFGYLPSQIKWSNVVFLSVMHILAIYGFYHCIVSPIKVMTAIFVCLLSLASGIGLGVGTHRLWAHRSFKAHWLFRIFLMIMETISVNGSIYSYARDHRTHHKWSDTMADPKNSNRGFFFAHIGWWLIKKDSKVVEFGSKLEYDDLLNDPIVKWQHKLYIPLVIIFSFLLPTVIPLLWREDLFTSFVACVGIRLTVVLHHMWTINSIAHIYGQRIYDKNLRPTENKLVIWLTMGEGYHNYHHAFPWDYTASYYKWYEGFNLATPCIVIASWFGLAYGMKKPSEEMILQCVEKRGHIEKVSTIHSKHILFRLVIGLIDWIIGITVMSWFIWSILVIKMALGIPSCYFDYNDSIWIN